MALLKTKIKYGVVTGVPSDRAPETTSIFKGIPFAKPPVGKLRFHEPVECEPWEGELTCDKWPNAPIQEPSPHYEGLRQSEDCLYMNIFTPAKDGGEKLPVMYWMYGGGFNYGTITTDTPVPIENALFRGEAINKRGVILVCVNYRVSIMGFMSHEKIIERDGHAGNYGLLDCIAGLKWIHENIAAFGGDPDNVTIFGQSAGGVLCRLLMQSPLCRDKGYFKHVIIQSGCSMNDPEHYCSSEWVAEWADKTLTAIGLNYNDLMNMDALKLAGKMPRKAYQLYTGLPDVQHPKKPGIFIPCIDRYSLTQPPGVAIYAGDYDQNLDIICGTVRGDELQPIKHCFEPVRYDDRVMRAVAYSPSVSLGRRTVQAGRKPVYGYFFERNVPNSGEKDVRGGGSYHSSEIAYEFGTMEYKQHPFTDYDYKLSEAIIDYWTNFAKTGNPNGNGFTEWTPFTKETPFVMDFRDDGFSSLDLIDNPKAERVIDLTTNYPGCLDEIANYI
jgi:para-nitrobenzyl esterase